MAISDSGDPLPLADLATLRERTYRLVSQALLYPDEERLSLLGATARELKHDGATLARFAFFVEWSQLLRVASELAERSAEDAQGSYVSLFAVGAPAVPCPPFESAYYEGDVAPGGWVRAKLDRTYDRAGLELSSEVAEPVDHVALELEFMALLAGREAQAWEQRSAAGEAAAATAWMLEQQRDFLDEHLCVWFPAFSARLAAADEDGAYAALSRLANAFLVHDRDLLSALLEHDRTPLVATDAHAAGAGRAGLAP